MTNESLQQTLPYIRTPIRTSIFAWELFQAPPSGGCGIVSKPLSEPLLEPLSEPLSKPLSKPLFFLEKEPKIDFGSFCRAPPIRREWGIVSKPLSEPLSKLYQNPYPNPLSKLLSTPLFLLGKEPKIGFRSFCRAPGMGNRIQTPIRTPIQTSIETPIETPIPVHESLSPPLSKPYQNPYSRNAE